MAKELGRYKGESMQALECIIEHAQRALAHLRKDGKDVCLPPTMVNSLHTVHTSMGKLFSAQHRARAFKDVKQLIERQ